MLWVFTNLRAFKTPKIVTMQVLEILELKVLKVQISKQ